MLTHHAVFPHSWGRRPRGLAYGAHGRFDSATVPKEFEAAVFPSRARCRLSGYQPHFVREPLAGYCHVCLSNPLSGGILSSFRLYLIPAFLYPFRGGGDPQCCLCVNKPELGRLSLLLPPPPLYGGLPLRHRPPDCGLKPKLKTRNLQPPKESNPRYTPA